jgi:hypothetical protein
LSLAFLKRRADRTQDTAAASTPERLKQMDPTTPKRLKVD